MSIRLLPRFSLWHLMALILALAPGFALTRLNPFLGTLAAILGAELAILGVLGSRAGPVALRLVMAAAVSVALVACWFAVRDLLLYVGIRLTRPESPFTPPWKFPLGSADYRHVLRLAGWEAWSLLRWWLLFGALTCLLPVRGMRRLRGSDPAPSLAEESRRLFGFAPWLIVLEVGALGGLWLVRGFNIVPEPSTLFAAGPLRSLHELPMFLGIALLASLLSWMPRLSLPFLVVGVAYFRGVARLSWRRSLLGALIVLPVAAVLSTLWSSLYIRFLTLGITPG